MEIRNTNWAVHLLTRAEGLLLSDDKKAVLWSQGRGVPIGISPSGVAWYCYHNDGSEKTMRANLDKLWENVAGLKPESK